jgi:hypothetical protein
VLQAVSTGARVVPVGLAATRSRPETAVAVVMAVWGVLVPAVGLVAGEATPPLSVTAAMVVPVVMAVLRLGIEDQGLAGPAALVVSVGWMVATVVPVAMAAGVA